MSTSRIRHLSNRMATESFVPVATNQPLSLVGASSAGAASTSMVMVPVVVQHAWQAQLYQLAYQQAVAALSPPRHHRRFFSAWN